MSDQRPGLVGTALDLGKSVVAALPPAFLILSLLNFAFLYLVLNFTEHQNDQRLSILNSVIAQCLGKQ
jgi:hypothetical protein